MNIWRFCMHWNQQVILSLLFYQASHARIYSLPKLQKSRRVMVSRPVCFGLYNANRIGDSVRRTKNSKTSPRPRSISEPHSTWKNERDKKVLSENWRVKLETMFTSIAWLVFTISALLLISRIYFNSKNGVKKKVQNHSFLE